MSEPGPAPQSPLRPTDEPARRQARVLLRAAPYGALGVLDPVDAAPAVSRVLIGTTADGCVLLLTSELSAHTRAMMNDGRVSLLVGEPGKGDPLTHPRLTVRCRATPVDRASDDHGRMRERFLARHPKSKLYIDFADFLFFRLVPEKASLNGGFGKAYALDADVFQIHANVKFPDGRSEAQTLQDLRYLDGDFERRIRQKANLPDKGRLRICGLDAAGIDFFWGNLLHRWEFPAFAHTFEAMREMLSN